MRRDINGFTLVELLIAMAFFSFILLFISTGFLVINRAYNKGIIIKLVQDEGRRTMELLSREIRSVSAINLVNDVGGNQVCVEIGDDSYYWTEPIDSTNANSPKRLLKMLNTSCIDITSPPSPNAIDILHERVGVQYLDIESLPSTASPFYKITIALSSDTTDLVENEFTENVRCNTSSASQYCDVVKFSTVISARQ